MKTKKKKVWLWIPVLLVLLIGIFFFALRFWSRMQDLKSHFLPGTTVNGMDVSAMTVSDLEDKLGEYELVITERSEDGASFEETITGEQIGLKLSDTKPLEEILEQQTFRKKSDSEKQDYNDANLFTVDKEALDDAIHSLKNFNEAFVEAPMDAYISDYEEGKEYQIVKETNGNKLDEEKAEEVIKKAVAVLKEEVDLISEDCYEKPEVTSEDASLRALTKKLNTYIGITITYQFGEQKEAVDGSMIHSWLTVEGDQVTLDQEQVKEFVAGLRKKYDTIFRTRTFKTTYGPEVTIAGGDYGWWMNYSKEAEELAAMIEKGESGERTPVYYQTAESYGTPDYGNTYVEINLTAQHMFFYQNGELIMESDFVSGNTARGYDTPEGIYSLTYKERDSVLVGETYQTPVSYWMPFNENIGMHDAIWRDKFGKDIYKTNGSHGCVNMPYQAAKELFGYLEKGMPVVCYELKDTETDKTTEQTPKDIAQSVIDAIDRIGSATDKQKAVARARELYNQISAKARTYVTNYDQLVKAERG